MATLLIVVIFLPLAGALALFALGRLGKEGARALALGVSLLTFAGAAVLVANYPRIGAGALEPTELAAAQDYALTDLPWIGGAAAPDAEFSQDGSAAFDGLGFDIRFQVGLDGIGLWMFGLSALLMLTSVLVSWQAITERAALFYGMLLLLEFGCLGVFAARDLLLFYVFFEFTLLPLFFLIGIWGSEQRRYAAVKFFLFTLAGSLLTFLGLLAIVFWGSHRVGALAAWSDSPPPRLTFSIPELQERLGRRVDDVFEPLDRNGDDWLTIDEAAGAKTGQRRERAQQAFLGVVFQQLETGEGALTLAEFERQGGARERFADVDTDRDGRLSKTEFQNLPADAAPRTGAWRVSRAALEETDMAFERLLFLALLVGFAIKTPLFPVHTWLPLAHVQAPTAGSVFLAGVLLKIGVYGFLRFNIPMLPEATLYFAPWLLGISVVGILYGALVALAQGDMKRLIAYSSVSHMGFCILGLFALNPLGVQGGTLQMLNHGVSTGALFAIVGMLYERYHTREIKHLGGLARRLPLLALMMVVFTMSSIGLPGLNGFAGEFLLLLGMFQRAWTDPPAGHETLYRVLAVLSVLGVVLGAWYMLYLVQRVFFGPVREPAHGAGSHAHGAGDHDDGSPEHAGRAPHGVHDLNPRELAALAPLLVFALWIGLQPRFFLDRMAPSLERSLSYARQAEGPALAEPSPADPLQEVQFSAGQSPRGAAVPRLALEGPLPASAALSPRPRLHESVRSP